jgi:hypothetical protein
LGKQQGSFCAKPDIGRVERVAGAHLLLAYKSEGKLGD